MNFDRIDEGLLDGIPQFLKTASGPYGDRERGAVEFGIREDLHASRNRFRGKFVDLREHRHDGVGRTFGKRVRAASRTFRRSSGSDSVTSTRRSTRSA